jgi:hypothetical protein
MTEGARLMANHKNYHFEGGWGDVKNAIFDLRNN